MGTQGKLTYIFVAGVEGCGHHGLNPVISTALAHSREVVDSGGAIVRDKHRLKRIFNWYWCHRHPFGFTRPLVRAMINRFFRAERRKSRKNGQVRVVLEDNSFPAGKYRHPDRQWNIVEMVRPYADEIYLIGLYRDPMAATFSHPGFDGGLEAHAQVLRRSQIYINDQLQRLGEVPQLFVRYEDLVHGQDGLGPALAQFLGIDVEDVREGFKRVRPSRKDWRRDMAPEDQRRLQALFSEEQAQAYWPLFAAAPKHS